MVGSKQELKKKKIKKIYIEVLKIKFIFLATAGNALSNSGSKLLLPVMLAGEMQGTKRTETAALEPLSARNSGTSS